jgi:hypothetical protein
MFIRALFALITLEALSGEEVIQIMFGLKESESYEPYNNHFDDLGYDSSNFLYLIGLQVSFIFVLPLLCFIDWVLKRSKRLW